MAPARAAATMAPARGLARGAFTRARRREGGNLLVQLAGTAMRAFRSAPVGRAHEDFAVAPALVTMKFVNWHAGRIAGTAEKGNPGVAGCRSFAQIELVSGFAVRLNKLERTTQKQPCQAGHRGAVAPGDGPDAPWEPWSAEDERRLVAWLGSWRKGNLAWQRLPPRATGTCRPARRPSLPLANFHSWLSPPVG